MMKTNIPAVRQWIIVEIETNVFGLLANAPQLADRQKELEPYFAVLETGVCSNEEVLSLSVGVGHIHKGFEGLQQSYMDAMR
ncbi:hypothetical protein [Paenibacillus sp. S150]|uniref:hypothetical protein n=1 Tax=Paenibacillus sp. S150 TaxID=2749826 RepID=UPI001C59E747|nr:hypothetical protein [Paenibacillus sp. S150]MBW4084583.1 hypothetical protein [Paenibacillus sp. S150]